RAARRLRQPDPAWSRRAAPCARTRRARSRSPRSRRTDARPPFRSLHQVILDIIVKFDILVKNRPWEVHMITAVTSFRLPKPITREEARAIFLSTAPIYRGVAGLSRKTYVLSEDGMTAGGIYFWNSRREAEALYT